MQIETGTNCTLLSLLLLYVATAADCLNNMCMGEKRQGRKPLPPWT